MSPELIFLLFFFPSYLCRSLPVNIPHPTGMDSERVESSKPLLEYENIWLHIARDVLNISDFCLGRDVQANSVLSSCLIGVSTPLEVLQNYTIFEQISKELDYSEMYSWGLSTREKDKDMYSIQLSQVTNASHCVNFTHCQNQCLDLGEMNNLQCKVTSQVTTASAHTKLPSGWFFICGVKAFSYIPANANGGPCSIGRLTMHLPQKQHLEANNKTKEELILDENCNDKLDLLSQAEYGSLSKLLTAGSSIKAYTQINKLACTMAKALNATSQAIAVFSEELGQVREEVLVNRATVDYLFLLHNHGCDEFKGMCCFNLTGNTEQTNKTREQSENITEGKFVFGNPFSWITTGIKKVIAAIMSILGLGIFACFCFYCGPTCCSIGANMLTRLPCTQRNKKKKSQNFEKR